MRLQPGENGCIGCEEGRPIVNTVVCDRCVEELGKVQKNYLVAGFELTNQQTLIQFMARFPHSRMTVSASTLFTDRYATVENAANVVLEDADVVYADQFGRVNAFEHSGRFYTVAYS